jgi:hypothetical protein
VHTIDEGINVLTGVEAGEPDANGLYPDGTINQLVSRKLAELGDRLRRFGPGRAERDGQQRDGNADKEPQPEPATDPAPAEPDGR